MLVVVTLIDTVTVSLKGAQLLIGSSIFTVVGDLSPTILKHCNVV